MPALEPGTVVAGRYRIEALLGEGGMGRVHLARHVELGERVALKVLRRDRALGADAEERLRREAKAVARMRGENIVRVTDAGVDDEAGRFLVMEYVPGRSLAEIAAQDGPQPVASVVDWAMQVCVALAEAHGLGIVHRDLKPSNLRLTKRADGTALVKVLDFGIAKVDHLALQTLTETSSMLGSPHYMSPEQVREARTVDARTDIWSLGVVVYELLTGRRPFEAFTLPGVVAAITVDDPSSPREHRDEVPEALAAVVMRMLAKRPDDRFASAAKAAEALAPFGGPDADAVVRRILATDASPRGWTDPPAKAPSPAALEAEASAATVGATSTEHAPSAASPERAASRVVPALAAAGIVLAIVAVAAIWPTPRASSPPAANAATAPPPPVPRPEPSASAEPVAATAEPIATASASAPAPKAVPHPTAVRAKASAAPPDEFDFGTRK